MSNRRTFIRHLAGLGITLPFVRPRSVGPVGESVSLPLVVCSRGADYGRKVLDPAWEKLVDTGSILDAIETGANVPELDPADQTVGYGGFPNEDGVVSLDASIMAPPTIVDQLPALSASKGRAVSRVW
jgi:N4-(beta-N-acetylglucosaminyl)-L-asparaginase